MLARFHLAYHMMSPFPKMYRDLFSTWRLIPKGSVMS